MRIQQTLASEQPTTLVIRIIESSSDAGSGYCRHAMTSSARDITYPFNSGLDGADDVLSDDLVPVLSYLEIPFASQVRPTPTRFPRML